MGAAKATKSDLSISTLKCGEILKHFFVFSFLSHLQTTSETISLRANYILMQVLSFLGRNNFEQKEPLFQVGEHDRAL